MELEPEDIIVLSDEATEGYVPGVYNTIRVKDLLNQLNLLPELRVLTRNIDKIEKSNSGSNLVGGSIKIKLTVEHSPSQV